MNIISRKVLLYGLGVVAMAATAFFVFITTHAQAPNTESDENPALVKLDWAIVEKELVNASYPEVSSDISLSAEVPPLREKKDVN